MKASDITDDAFVDAVRRVARDIATGLGRPYNEHGTEQYDGGSSWSSASLVYDEFPDYPWKVVLAKARQCLKKGLIGGCGCGCRGDWHVLVKP